MEVDVLPKYLLVRDLVVREITSGVFLDGERLPPERDMAASLGVSVGTLRKGLTLLESEGHLERRQGSGNYVRVTDGIASVYAFFRLQNKAGGGRPTASTLSVARLKKPADLPDIGSGHQAFRIRRLRRLDGVPAALEEIWLDARFADRLQDKDLPDSLYQFFKAKLGLWISRADDQVSPNQFPDWPEDKTFGPNEPCGFVERLSYDQNGEPAEASYTWFDARVARYVQRIKL